MALLETLQQISAQQNHAMQLTDLEIGTVVKVNPLEIVRDVAQAPLRSEVLYLTESVVGKYLSIRKHKHGDDGEEAYVRMVCYENGAALPEYEGTTYLNRPLAVGDKVLMLSVQHGQKFVILSRVF